MDSDKNAKQRSRRMTGYLVDIADHPDWYALDTAQKEALMDMESTNVGFIEWLNKQFKADIEPTPRDYMTPKITKIKGENTLDIALREILSRIDQKSKDSLYMRASVLGGDLGSRLMLQFNFERCSLNWGRGDLIKAKRLLLVWASTAVLTAYQQSDNQAAVRDVTARNFSLFFNSSEEELKAELFAYQEGRKADNEICNTGLHIGAFLPSQAVLYLRVLKALGDIGVPHLKMLPVPIHDLRAMEDLNPKLYEILDISILLSVRDWMTLIDVFVLTIEKFKKYIKTDCKNA